MTHYKMAFKKAIFNTKKSASCLNKLECFMLESFFLTI